MDNFDFRLVDYYQQHILTLSADTITSTVKLCTRATESHLFVQKYVQTGWQKMFSCLGKAPMNEPQVAHNSTKLRS